MNSRTKVQLSNSEIEKIFISAGIENIADIQPLGSGEYNSVYSAKSEGTEYALKIAPKKETPVLTYERSMLQTELYWYSRMKSIEGVSVPKIYYSDLSCRIAPCEFFIMEKIQGGHLNSMKLTDDEKFYSQREKALFAARLHKVKNDRYGYVQNGLHDDWYQALRHMTLALLNDCKLKGKRSRRGERLLRLIDKHREILEKAECVMVNFDIWDPNCIISRKNGELEYTWIDPERSFWGDPVADFVCLGSTNPFKGKSEALESYNSISDNPIKGTREEQIRWAAAMGYLALIMETEKYYRYTPLHFGWWRNVSGSAWFYSQAFNVLN